MKVIITGAQFGNKGAQSLLFNVVDQLRKRYKDVEIYFLTLDGNKISNEKNYRFNTVYGIYFYKQYYSSFINRIKLIVIENIKRVVKKKFYTIDGSKEIRSIFETADLLIDVSGYALSSKWSLNSNKQFLNSFSEANKYGIKTIIMPQSFGPFNYCTDQKGMDSIIKETLSGVDLIFAREQEGYDLLISKYGLSNVRLSPDLVLQNKNIDLSNIYFKIPTKKKPELRTSDNNVCVIPNTQTVNHGSFDKIIALYHGIIKELQSNGKNIYIFNHANDMALCRSIYDSLSDKKSVYLIEDELNSIEYEEFVKQFDYIICSRYHGIVHAYKQMVPAVILGWAIKYQELANLFGQGEYIFDVTRDSFEANTLYTSIEKMNNRYQAESSRIGVMIDTIQSSTCFDACWEILDGKEH